MLSQFLSEVPGYFRTDTESFPWHVGAQGVWYAVFTVEAGKIKRYGFTSAKNQRPKLLAALNALGDTEASLLGIWNGQWKTALFVLDIETAKLELAK